MTFGNLFQLSPIYLPW